MGGKITEQKIRTSVYRRREGFRQAGMGLFIGSIKSDGGRR